MTNNIKTVIEHNTQYVISLIHYHFMPAVTMVTLNPLNDFV